MKPTGMYSRRPLAGLHRQWFTGKLIRGRYNVVRAEAADKLLATTKSHAAGVHNACIGRVTQAPAGTVILETGIGGERIVDMLIGEQLPRIC